MLLARRPISAPAGIVILPETLFFGTVTVAAGERFTPASVVPGVNASLLTWDFGNGTTATGKSVIYDYPSAGTFFVSYSVSNTNLVSSFDILLDSDNEVIDIDYVDPRCNRLSCRGCDNVNLNVPAVHDVEGSLKRFISASTPTDGDWSFGSDIQEVTVNRSDVTSVRMANPNNMNSLTADETQMSIEAIDNMLIDLANTTVNGGSYRYDNQPGNTHLNANRSAAALAAIDVLGIDGTTGKLWTLTGSY